MLSSQRKKVVCIPILLQLVDSQLEVKDSGVLTPKNRDGVHCRSGGTLLKSWGFRNLKQEDHRNAAPLCSTDPVEVTETVT